ncbi:MAG: hypothetical protein R3A79_08415 [Nannocystaceae bacterium]
MDWRATIPVHVDLDGRTPRILEIELGGIETPALLDDAELRGLVRRHPERLRWRRVAADAPRRAQATDLGLLFHVARCGSTHAARLVAASGEARVLVEPEALNAALVAPLDPPARQRLVVALVDAIAGEGRTPLLIKLSSWNALFIAELRAALPRARAAVLVRAPLEVLVSLTQRPPPWLVDGGEAGPCLAAQLLDARPGPLPAGASASERAAALLAAILTATLAEPEAPRFVDYEELPDAAWEVLLGHLLGLRPAARTIAAMRERAHVDAKRPERRFTGDSAAKRASASAALRGRAAALAELYAEARARARAHARADDRDAAGDPTPP